VILQVFMGDPPNIDIDLDRNLTGTVSGTAAESIAALRPIGKELALRLVLVISVTLILFGCSEESAQRLPTAPSPPVQTASPPPPPSDSLAWLWGFVVAPSGGCIEGATVQVVGGQGLGQSITQTTPCDAWAYDGGFEFKDLTPGVAMTLRASAPGWSTQENTFVPHLGGQQAVLLALSRIE
jgi:hypothetical protein